MKIKEMPSDTCQVNELYGDWVYINNYLGRLTEIDTLKKEPFKSKFGSITLTYHKNGKYINDQGDYSTKGRFTVDLNKCIIDQVEDKSGKDTLSLQITYLDRDYLLLVKITDGNQSYFYKRK